MKGKSKGRGCEIEITRKSIKLCSSGVQLQRSLQLLSLASSQIKHLSMSSGWGGRRGIGEGFDQSLWSGVRAFELSFCPGGRDI